MAAHPQKKNSEIEMGYQWQPKVQENRVIVYSNLECFNFKVIKGIFQNSTLQLMEKIRCMALRIKNNTRMLAMATVFFTELTGVPLVNCTGCRGNIL